MMVTRFLLALLSGLLLVTACKEGQEKVVERATVAFQKEGELSILRSPGDSVITRLDIEIADTEYETQTGLMYRDAMDEHQGMLFVFPDVAMHSFYMKNTKIPLDILFIDAGHKIASIHANAQPMDESGLSSRVPVKYVLEINAGLVAKWGIQLGDSIDYSHQ